MAKQFAVGVSPIPLSNEYFFINALKDTGPIGPRPHLYGADASYCPRKNYLLSQDWGAKTIDWDATSQIYMGVGNGIEDAIASGLMRSNKLLFQNLYIPPMEPLVRGKIDFVYLDANDDVAIGELKTCGALPVAPKDAHLSQLMTYAAVGGYKVANLIYVSRNVTAGGPDNTLAIRVFPIELKKEDLVATLTRIVYSSKAIQYDFLPSVPSEFKKSRNCTYCPFYDYCWNAKKLEVDVVDWSLDREKEVWAEAEDVAWKLYHEQDFRYVKSLRHIFRNLGNASLKGRVIDEIEKYEEF